MRALEAKLMATDGTLVPHVVWQHEREPRARVLIVHGRGEHGGRYAPVAAALEPHGIECAAIDLRGFGRSVADGHAPNRIGRFEEYLLDIDVGVGRTLPGGVPVFLLGHSAGGLAVVRYVEEQGERARSALRGVILSSPFLGMRSPVPPLKMLFVRLFSLVRPGFPLPTSGLPNTRDEACWRAYREDPLTVKSPTARWLTEVMKHQRLALERARGFGVPLLVLQGGADTASDPGVSRRFAEAAGGEYKEYAGCLHEVLMEREPERGQVLGDLAAWVLARAGAPAAT